MQDSDVNMHGNNGRKERKHVQDRYDKVVLKRIFESMNLDKFELTDHRLSN